MFYRVFRKTVLAVALILPALAIGSYARSGVAYADSVNPPVCPPTFSFLVIQCNVDITTPDMTIVAVSNDPTTASTVYVTCTFKTTGAFSGVESNGVVSGHWTYQSRAGCTTQMDWIKVTASLYRDSALVQSAPPSTLYNVHINSTNNTYYCTYCNGSWHVRAVDEVHFRQDTHTRAHNFLGARSRTSTAAMRRASIRRTLAFLGDPPPTRSVILDRATAAVQHAPWSWAIVVASDRYKLVR